MVTNKASENQYEGKQKDVHGSVCKYICTMQKAGRVKGHGPSLCGGVISTLWAIASKELFMWAE